MNTIFLLLQFIAVNRVQDYSSCVSFSRAAALPFSTNRAVVAPAPGNGALQTIKDGENLFIVRGSQVLVFVNAERERLLRTHPTNRVHPMMKVGVASSRVKSLVARLGLGPVGFRPWRVEVYPYSAAVAQERRGRAFVSFTVVPYGYDSSGYGNCLDIVLDAKDGTLLRYRCESDWIYGRPTLKLSQAEAVHRASSIVGATGSKLGDTYTVKLQFMSTDSGLGSVRGESLRSKRTMRLVYALTSHTAFVKIDAETGECMGGLLLH